MKLTVLFILISNLIYAQDILVPRYIVESCRENYDIINKQKQILSQKDSIINNRDFRIVLDDKQLDKLNESIVLYIQKNTNSEAIIENKDKEIKNIKKSNKQILVLLTILEIAKDVALIIIFL
jgi:Fe-S cluster assembly iron-binding protein IscA